VQFVAAADREPQITETILAEITVAKHR